MAKACYPRGLLDQVGILNPHKRFAVELRKVATFRRQIRKGALKASQFPDTLTDGKGTITKPTGW